MKPRQARRRSVQQFEAAMRKPPSKLSTEKQENRKTNLLFALVFGAIVAFWTVTFWLVLQ